MIKFTKMHGACNDYLYVNTLLYNVSNPERAAVVWSARHTGVGSDGLVLIGVPRNPAAADYSMRIFNADGSEALMCGNASRCVGKYLYERGICRRELIRLETLSGVKLLRLHLEGEGEERRVSSVTVDMLEPRLEAPGQFTGELPAHDVPGFRAARFVSMGNPHYVLFVDAVDGVDLAAHGARLEQAPCFPERCNIEFAEILPSGAIRTRVWERGSGITMACGTGACATAVAAAEMGLAARQVDIIMDGGTLHIDWDAADGHVHMTGPAAFVCDGEIAIP